MAKLKDMCPLADTKRVFPTSEVTISTTGVPKEFISKNMPTGPQQTILLLLPLRGLQGLCPSESLTVWTYLL